MPRLVAYAFFPIVGYRTHHPSELVLSFAVTAAPCMAVDAHVGSVSVRARKSKAATGCPSISENRPGPGAGAPLYWKSETGACPLIGLINPHPGRRTPTKTGPTPLCTCFQSRVRWQEAGRK